MALLRRRSAALTGLLAGCTVLAYAACVAWVQPGFMETHYYAKQRLWQTFLSTCDCDGPACAESFDLTMMHGSLYDKLLAASRHGARPVVQHLVLQPHKLGAVYPARLRMYAHMGLVLPRSLALLHMWWLAVSEELAGAMQHLSQGVPLVLDPESREAMRVEPDIVIRCTLAEGDDEAGQAKRADADQQQRQQQQQETDGGGHMLPAAPEQAGQQAESGDSPPASAASSSAASRNATAEAAPTGSDDPDGEAGKGKGVGREGGSRKQRGSRGEDDMRPFRCVLVDAAGRAALLRIPPPPPSAAGAASTGKGRTPPPSPPQEEDEERAQSRQGAQGAAAAEGGGGGGAPDAGQSSGVCEVDGADAAAAAGGGAAAGSCPADVRGGGSGAGPAASDVERAADLVDESEADAGPMAAPGATAAHGDGGSADAGDGGGAGRGAGSAADGGGSQPGGGSEGRGGKERRRGLDGRAGGGICRNTIYIRPPRKAEVSEHVRDRDASPLGLSPRQLLAAALPRAAALAGWLALPHVMMARHVLMLAPPPPAGAAAGGAAAREGGGGGTPLGQLPALQLPQLQVGTLLMLVAGGLLTTVELLVAVRVGSELLSLRRPRRSWARRRAVAWRVAYEAMLQPLREALLSWNITHFVALPLLRLALPPCGSDLVLLLPLAYCVGVLGAGNADAAARASTALLRVARRARQHEGGYQLLLLSIADVADPRVIPRALRTLFLIDVVGASGRAAVQAALLEEAPGVAAALAAEQQRAAAAAAAAGGDGGAGGAEAEGEFAAAMAARVAPAVERAPLAAGDGGGGAGEHDYDSDEDEQEVERAAGGAGGPVVLRWPAPLQLPAEAHEWEDVPRGFTCAITQHLMSQPAMLVSPDLPSAPTYERAAIQKWLAGQMRDPKSNTPLRSYSLLPNEDLHRAIDDWVGQKLRAMQSQQAEPRGQRRRGHRARWRGGVDLDGDGLPSRGEPEPGPSRSAGRGATRSRVSDSEGGGIVSDRDFGDGGSDGGESGGGSGMLPSCSTASGQRRTASEARRRRGGGGSGAARSASVLSSLAQGAAGLLDTGVEVVSRGAAAVAAAAAAAAAAGAGGGARARRGPRAGSEERGGKVGEDDTGADEGAEAG